MWTRPSPLLDQDHCNELLMYFSCRIAVFSSFLSQQFKPCSCSTQFQLSPRSMLLSWVAFCPLLKVYYLGNLLQKIISFLYWTPVYYLTHSTYWYDNFTKYLFFNNLVTLRAFHSRNNETASLILFKPGANWRECMVDGNALEIFFNVSISKSGVFFHCAEERGR